jgi:hypothetical protein
VRNQILFSSLSFFLSKRSRALDGEGKNLNHSNSARSHCIKLQGVSAKFFFLFFFFFFSILLQSTLNQTTTPKKLCFNTGLLCSSGCSCFTVSLAFFSADQNLTEFLSFLSFSSTNCAGFGFQFKQKGFVHIFVLSSVSFQIAGCPEMSTISILVVSFTILIPQLLFLLLLLLAELMPFRRNRMTVSLSGEGRGGEGRGLVVKTGSKSLTLSMYRQGL